MTNLVKKVMDAMMDEIISNIFDHPGDYRTCQAKASILIVLEAAAKVVKDLEERYKYGDGSDSSASMALNIAAAKILVLGDKP